MKYRLSDETKVEGYSILHRIVCETEFECMNGTVHPGDLGGWVESERNLSQEGNAWIAGDAKVCDNANVSDNGYVYGNAVVGGNARVYDDALVFENACIGGNAQVYGKAIVFNSALVLGNVQVYENARVFKCATVRGNAQVYGDARVCGETIINGFARVFGESYIYGEASIRGNAQIFDTAHVSGNAIVYDNAILCGDVTVRAQANIGGDARISSCNDFMVLKNSWSSGRYFTYTASNKMWRAGCFYGTGDELIKKAYADSELSGKCYEASVRYIEKIERIKAGIKETPMAHHLKPKFEFAGSYGYDKDEVDELIAAKDAEIEQLTIAASSDERAVGMVKTLHRCKKLENELLATRCLADSYEKSQKAAYEKAESIAKAYAADKATWENKLKLLEIELENLADDRNNCEEQFQKKTDETGEWVTKYNEEHQKLLDAMNCLKNIREFILGIIDKEA